VSKKKRNITETIESKIEKKKFKRVVSKSITRICIIAIPGRVIIAKTRNICNTKFVDMNCKNRYEDVNPSEM
jgi:hypothetical protein